MAKNFKYFFESQYRTALRKLLRHGVEQPNRTSTPALVQSEPVHFVIDLEVEGVPALRGKKMFPEKALVETFWLMQGFHTLDFLHDNDVRYWDKFANSKKSIGNGYGVRLRNLNEVDQLDVAVNKIMSNPYSRRNVISFWDPANDKVVVPCYTTIHFLVVDDKLDMHVTQRSGDAFIGVPTDAIVFSYFAGIISAYTGVPLGKLYYTINSFHLYTNHMPQARKYLKASIRWTELYAKMPVKPNTAFIKWVPSINTTATIDNFLRQCLNKGLSRMFTLYPYKSFPFIYAEISI